MGTLKVIGSALYQWEIGRKIRVLSSVGNRAVVVQFAHPGDNEALSVTPREENGVIVADVPNILLQGEDKIVAFLVEMDESCVETTSHSVFHVVNRPKPADYIYTETEVLNYTYLDNRLKDLEGDGLANAVADYLKENPIETGATAEEAAQIQQNKQDIETLTREKLSADALPEAVDEALAQAKASGEFDGKDGQDGQDGYTPVKGVDYFDGQDGKDGVDGKDGYTPQKGVDYFDGADGNDGNDYVLTDADKQEIAEQAASMVEVPEPNEPLIGTTKEITPMQVAEAIAEGRPVSITHYDGRLGTITSNSFYTAEGVVLSNGLLPMDEAVTSTTLFGMFDNAEWFLVVVTIPSMDDIPTDEHINSLINTALGVIENGTY